MSRTRVFISVILCVICVSYLGFILNNDYNTAPRIKAKIKASRPLVLKPGIAIGATCINPRDGAQMVWVPAGYFSMGSTNPNSIGEPRRNIYLDGYWMYKYEVTVAQYRMYCIKTGTQMPTPPSWGWINNHPIVNVNWQDAADYAKWAGVFLPTEAQWEKAARGTDLREYPWGNVWYASKCNQTSTMTQPVGSYPAGASPYGCMDMTGNVWEWCADWFQFAYTDSVPTKNPTGPVFGEYRMQRGGGYDLDGNNYGRCSFRCRLTTTVRNPGSGFRCAITP